MLSITNIIKLIIASIILAIFLYFVLRHYDSSSIGSLFENLGLLGVVAIIAMQSLCYYLKALRFHALLASQPISKLSISKITLIHNAFNNIIPMRLGEASFPVLMRRYHQSSLLNSSLVLLAARVLDLGILVGFAGLFILIWAHISLTQAALLMLMAAGGLYFLYYCSRRPWILKQLNKQPKLHQMWHEIIASNPNQPWILLHSFGIWATKLLSYVIIIHASLDISFWQSLIAVYAIEATAILPINGFANLGTLQASMVISLKPFQFDPQEVFSAAVNLHLFILSFSLLCGLIAYLFTHEPKHD